MESRGFYGRGRSVSGRSQRATPRWTFPRWEFPRIRACFSFLRRYPAVWIAPLISIVIIVIVSCVLNATDKKPYQTLMEELDFALKAAGFENYKTIKGVEQEYHLSVLTGALYNKVNNVDPAMEAVLYMQFNEFNIIYGREHESYLDKVNRFTNFRNNILRISHSAMWINPSYSMAWNSFTDMSATEFMRLHVTKYVPAGDQASTVLPPPKQRDFSAFVDINYRDNNRLTPVKDQGLTGNAWAFAALGALEAHLKHKTKSDILLSEQQLIDCVTKDSQTTQMDPHFAYQYLSQTGVNQSELYPYTGVKGECRPVQGQHSYKITKFERVTDPDLFELLRKHGPLTVYVAVDPNWQFYGSGVLNSCGKEINHAALLVGVGEGDRGKYWLLKNSWGTDWGDKGYVKIARASGRFGNECGLAHAAIYPVDVPSEDLNRHRGVPTTVNV